MARGFFTLEQWVRRTTKSKPQWVAVCHVSGDETMSDVIGRLEKQGKRGFYRVIQTQRMIWAEMENGKLRLRKWHVGSSEGLARTAAAFERDRGKWPVSRAKKKKAK